MKGAKLIIPAIVIIDKESGSGVVPYLPLPELKKSGSNN